MRFEKWEACGNDFVVVDGRRGRVRLSAGLIRKLGDRRLGVGFDQLLLIQSGNRVKFFNQDGSSAHMCGNGLRAVARYLAEGKKAEIVLFTPVGPRRARVDGSFVDVEMGAPEHIGNSKNRIDVGNKHIVFFHLPKTNKSLGSFSKKIPIGFNAEFLQKTSNTSVRARVLENGVGETQACGSGAVAIAKALGAKKRIAIKFPGGTVWVRFEGSCAWLRGSVRQVFTGTIVN